MKIMRFTLSYRSIVKDLCILTLFNLQPVNRPTQLLPPMIISLPCVCQFISAMYFPTAKRGGFYTPLNQVCILKSRISGNLSRISSSAPSVSTTTHATQEWNLPFVPKYLSL